MFGDHLLRILTTLIVMFGIVTYSGVLGRIMGTVMIIEPVRAFQMSQFHELQPDIQIANCILSIGIPDYAIRMYLVCLLQRQ